MNNHINLSKVTPPSLPNIIQRPRLTKLLDRHQDRELTVVTGQAGTGKTTLVASYIKTLKIRSVWAILDLGDSDPTNLYYTLLQSLQYSFPEIDFTLQSSYPTISAGPRSDIQLFREWVQVLFSQIPVPLLIVFDDLENLKLDSPSLNFIKVLLEEAPPGVRFILLSRLDPPISLQKKKIRRLTYVLPQELLAFTEDEIHQFFLDICRISLPLKTVNRVHNLSEGWVGGVILLSEYLKRMPVSKWHDFESVYHSGNFREELFPYFGEEVFNSLSTAIQKVLLQLSIFEFIDLDFAKEFLSADLTEKILDMVAKRNLFVKNYDSKGERESIRYHNLFREFLNTQLHLRTGEGERETLYIRAGDLFDKRNDLESAVKFYLKANAYPRAAAVIERIGMQLVKMNRMAELKSWLAAIPDAVVQENPWLLYYGSIIARYTDPVGNLLRLRKALALFDQLGDSSGQLLTLSLLIESSFFAGEDLIPMALLIEKCEIKLQSLGSGQYKFEKAALLLQMSFVYSLKFWNARQGCWASQNAYMLLKQLDIQPLQITALANLFLAQQMMGNIPDAEITRQKTERLIKKYSHPELIANYLISLGQYYTFKGDLKKAYKHLRLAENEYEERGLLYLYLPLLIQDLFLLPHLGQFEEAEQKGEQLLSFSSRINNIFLKGLSLLFLGVSYYHKGDYTKALDLVNSSLPIFISEKTYSLTHIVTANHFLGLINMHLNRFDDAMTELNESTTKFEQTTWVAQGYFALALLYHKTDRTDMMVTYLDKAIELLEQKDQIHLQWLSRQDYTDACLLALEYKVNDTTGYVESLLATHLRDTASFGLDKLKHHRDKTIREKVFAIRKKIYRSRLPHIQLQTLGGFGVFMDKEPMKDEEWQRNNAKTLLKAIVAIGPKNIPRDCIIEELWPEVSPDVGDKRFKVELHRLRKSLEPGINKEFGSSYVHLKESLISLDNDLCEVDIDKYNALMFQGIEYKKTGELRKAADSFQKSINMYTGDFLAQDLYSTWAEQRRTELKKHHIETLIKLGQSYEELGTISKAISCYKKVVDSEPLYEYAYQRIILLYSTRGKTNQALQTYEKLKLILQTELQSEPEPFSKKIYEQIILKSSGNNKRDNK